MNGERKMQVTRPSVAPDLFKAGMQHYAAAVAVITAESNGVRSGMTATAVSSLSADPPSLLICTNKSSRTYGHIMDSRRFAVNLIPDIMPEVANAFASSDDLESQFQAAGTWLRSEAGLPVLQEAVVAFECDVEKWTNTKTHAVFFALVTAVHIHPSFSPLIYMERAFQSVGELGAGGK